MIGPAMDCRANHHGRYFFLELHFEGELILPWNIVRVVAETVPKDALPNAWLLLLLFAMKRFGVLEMLKVSTRNCMFTRSVTGKFLKRDRSTWRKWGPVSELRWGFPIVPRG